MPQPFFTVALWLSAAVAAGSAQVIAFENVNVVPMDRERVLERQTVVLRDGRIAEIAPAGKIKAPAGAIRVPAAGKYLMPGLAEMHGHFPPPNSPPELVEQVLALYVANGVTTVRAMQGNPAALETRSAVAGRRLLGPRLYVAGTPLSGQSAKTVEAAERMVREQKAAGYDLLKIQEGLTRQVYDAVVRTARELKIPFGGHVPNEVGVRAALAARQTSIDHLDNYLEALEADDSPVRGADPQTRSRALALHLDERKIPALARATRDAGVWNVPTMALWEIFFNDQTGDDLRRALPEVRFMPATMVDQWTQRKNTMVRERSVFMGLGAGSKSGERVIAVRKKMLKALHDAGAPIALGTDSPQVFSVPGFSIHRELAAMVECGLTPFHVLRTGTRNVAEYFGTLGETGTVEAGKRADLILLDANPLQNVAHIARRAGVVVNGRWIPESEIQALLEKIAAASAKM
jgi:imidazolonepropionase-like amidohydrolase